MMCAGPGWSLVMCCWQSMNCTGSHKRSSWEAGTSPITSTPFSPPPPPPSYTHQNQQGTSYPNALYAQSFSTDVAPSQAGRANTGGYALLWTNTGACVCGWVFVTPTDTNSRRVDSDGEWSDTEQLAGFWCSSFKQAVAVGSS